MTTPQEAKRTPESIAHEIAQKAWAQTLTGNLVVTELENSIRQALEAAQKQLLTLIAENAKMREALKKIRKEHGGCAYWKPHDWVSAKDNIEKVSTEALSTPPSEALSVVLEVVRALKPFVDCQERYQKEGVTVIPTNALLLASKSLAHFEAVFGRVE